MNLTPKFCGKCGSPVNPEGIKFCGKCGAPIAPPESESEEVKPRPRRVNPTPKKINKQKFSRPEKAIPFRPIPAKTAADSDSFLLKNLIASGCQWAIIWLIGWLPIGVLFSGFYDNIRAGNPEFYSQYPRTWNTTLPGMLTSFGIGSLLSGFLAGILIYKVVNEKELNPGILGTFPALVWALLWGSILGVMTIFFKEYIDDGTLIIIIPIFAMIFGGLIVSGLATILLEKKYDFSATTKEKKSLAIGWAACSLIGVIVAMFF